MKPSREAAKREAAKRLNGYAAEDILISPPLAEQREQAICNELCDPASRNAVEWCGEGFVGEERAVQIQGRGKTCSIVINPSPAFVAHFVSHNCDLSLKGRGEVVRHSDESQNRTVVKIMQSQIGVRDEKPITCHPEVPEAQQCTMPKPNLSCHPELVSGSQYIKIPQQVRDENSINVKNLTS